MSLSLCKKIGTFVRQVHIMLLSHLTIAYTAVLALYGSISYIERSLGAVTL